MILKTGSLSSTLLKIIRDKSTEHPFTGEYENYEEEGTYLCRQCGTALFRSKTKFNSSCGWPSFDEEIEGMVKRVPDKDGHRIEILCANCDAHLGHVFQGENFTSKNTRHCVNSASLDFVADFNVKQTEEIIVAAGCFWGVEYYFKKLIGVLKTEVGYIGGHKQNPTYKEVCADETGHVEAIRVIFDPQKISAEKLMQYFFEIHDPTQINGQGPDIGQQYLSVIFYYNNQQKELAEKLKKELIKKDLKIATKILPVDTFWAAEKYHQQYYAKNGKEPYCHSYTKRFD